MAKTDKKQKDTISVECSLQEIKIIVKLLRSAQVPGAKDKILVGQLQQKWEQLLPDIR